MKIPIIAFVTYGPVFYSLKTSTSVVAESEGGGEEAGSDVTASGAGARSDAIGAEGATEG